MPQGQLLLFIVIGAALVAGVAYSAWQAKKRREAFAAVGQALGLRFDPSNNRSVDELYHFLDKLDQGSNRYAFNRLSGTYRGHEVQVFDFHYETYSHSRKGGRRTHHHYFSFFLLHVADSYPELTITSEHIFSKIGQFLGFDDIDFESAEFSQAFCVRSRDKKFAYDICHPRMMEYLLTNRDLSIEMEAHCISLFFARRLAPEHIERNLGRLISLRGLIPEYVTPSR
jgi:hypothetical protein